MGGIDEFTSKVDQATTMSGDSFSNFILFGAGSKALLERSLSFKYKTCRKKLSSQPLLCFICHFKIVFGLYQKKYPFKEILSFLSPKCCSNLEELNFLKRANSLQFTSLQWFYIPEILNNLF